MEETPLTAHSLAEIALYFLVTPCPACGAGPLEVESPPGGTDSDDMVVCRNAHCRSCDATASVSFRLAGGDAPDNQPPPVLNATNEPSQIVDVGQWVTLHALHVNAATNMTNVKEKRVSEIRARQCLAEALKFYQDDNDLPPASACFHDASRQRLKDHPEAFSRQRLINMAAALPKPFAARSGNSE